MRKIDECFIRELKEGSLSYFLQQVKNNRQDYCLEIRDGYINIYYRGGNLLRITQLKNGYKFYFDPKYCLNKGDDSNYQILQSLNPKCMQDHIVHFNMMRNEMDSWLSTNQKPEREFQHKLLVNNPQIIDIEYAPAKIKATGEKLNIRLDILMVDGDKLIIVENKYGIGAITGTAGLQKHYGDICNLLNSKDLYAELLESVKEIADAKYKLGLLDAPIQQIDKTKTEILFLLADFKENSETLKNELKATKISLPIKLLKMSGKETIIDFDKAEKS